MKCKRIIIGNLRFDCERRRVYYLGVHVTAKFKWDSIVNAIVVNRMK